MNKEELEDNLLELSRQIAYNNMLLKIIVLYLLGDEAGKEQIKSCNKQIDEAFDKIKQKYKGDENE